jgi:hypothetical protein
MLERRKLLTKIVFTNLNERYFNVNGRIILKCILEGQDVRVSVSLNWSNTGFRGGIIAYFVLTKVTGYIC